MTLDHVSQRAYTFIITGAPIHTELFGDRNLHPLHVAPIPETLEDGIRESKNEQVLDGLLPQIMIDPIDLFLAKILVDDTVEFDGTIEIVTKVLLYDDV